MDNLQKKYDLNEIAKKTHISPLALKRLFNYEFEKLDNIKVKGFIKILETEYPNFDFSELKEKFEEYSKKDENEIIEVEKEDSTKVYLIVFAIIIIVAGLYFVLNKKEFKKESKQIQKTEQKIETNNSSIQPIVTSNENNENKETIDTNESIENNETNITSNVVEDKKVIITPLEKVWFKVTYLDDGSSKEYLTSHEIDLNGSKRIFIKFGHGMIKIDYNGKTLEPNTRKITRVIIEDGDINITKKRVKEFE